MAAAIGNFILWLYDRASEENRVPLFDDDTQSRLVLSGLRGEAAPEDPAPENYLVGLELRSGTIRAEQTRRVQRAALRRLQSYSVALLNVCDSGYSPLNVRALLQYHWWDLRVEDVGSEGHCILMDLQSAINASSNATRTVAWLLVAGYGAQEVGAVLSGDGKKMNGSRLVSRAASELAHWL